MKILEFSIRDSACQLNNLGQVFQLLSVSVFLPGVTTLALPFFFWKDVDSAAQTRNKKWKCSDFHVSRHGLTLSASNNNCLSQALLENLETHCRHPHNIQSLSHDTQHSMKDYPWLLR